jgi:hypothetical protein
MKVADVKLIWTPSVSDDVVKQVVSVSIDGAEPTLIEVGPEVQSVMTEVLASQSVVFSVSTTDAEGFTTVSELYSFAVGNLEAPQPATFLAHEVVAIREVDDVPVAPARVR